MKDKSEISKNLKCLEPMANKFHITYLKVYAFETMHLFKFNNGAWNLKFISIWSKNVKNVLKNL